MIRNYKSSDFPMISEWWMSHNEPGPLPGNIPEDSSFILEYEGIPATSISVILTNTKFVYFENFVRNPKFNDKIGKQCTKELWDYATEFAKSKNYDHIIFVSYKDKIKARYEELGAKRTLDNLSSFVIGLGD
jgi:hypothetical protein